MKELSHIWSQVQGVLSRRAITMWLCVKKTIGIWTHMSFKELYLIKSLQMSIVDN